MWRLFPTPQGKAAFTKARRPAFFSTGSPFAFQLPRPFNMPTEPRDICLGIDSGTTAAKPGGVFANGEPVSRQLRQSLTNSPNGTASPPLVSRRHHIFPKQRAEPKLVVCDARRARAVHRCRARRALFAQGLRLDAMPQAGCCWMLPKSPGGPAAQGLHETMAHQPACPCARVRIRSATGGETCS
jgi:hypothetical protein